MGLKVTKKQKAILDFIEDYTDENGVSPSYREIAAGVGLKSVSSVAEHIDNLVALGALKKAGDGSARTLQVVDISFPETTSLFRTRMQSATDDERVILRKAAKILRIEGIENE